MTTVDINAEDTAYKVDFQYDDIDLSEYSEEELLALGISQEDINALRGEETEEESEEEEEEAPEEEEEEEEQVEEEEEKPAKREPRIPKSRFDEAVAKEREKAIRAEERARYLEERIEQLLEASKMAPAKQAEVEPEFDFATAEEQYAEHLISGEVKEAAALRVKIEKERDKYVQKLLKSVTEEAKKESRKLSEEDKKEIVIQKALTTYPFLDDKSPDFDKELTEEINFLAIGYETKYKMSPAEALQKAVDKLAKPKVKTEVVKKKVAEAKAKKVDAMKKQPPSVSSAKSIKDKSVDDFDWENMSQKEFEELYKKSPKLVNEALRKSYI